MLMTSSRSLKKQRLNSSKMSRQLKVHTLESWLQKARKACSTTNPHAPETLLAHVLKVSKEELITNGHKPISQKSLRKLDNLLGRLLAGRPLAQVIGKAEFSNIRLKVNSRVLSPRAETEQLVEYLINELPRNSKLIDIGTGSGAIGLSVKESRKDLHLYLTDLNKKTLSLAKSNARLNHLKINDFTVSSLIKKVDQNTLENSFIVANLPYLNRAWRTLPAKKLGFEPDTALYAKKDGLDLIIKLIWQLQKRDFFQTNNWLLLEHDPKQLQNLKNFCQKNNLQLISVGSFCSLVKL